MSTASSRATPGATASSAQRGGSTLGNRVDGLIECAGVGSPLLWSFSCIPHRLRDIGDHGGTDARAGWQVRCPPGARVVSVTPGTEGWRVVRTSLADRKPPTSFAASSRTDQDRGRERALKIAVCLKRVPEMELRFSIAADRKSLDQGGLKYEISDFDGYALEVGAPAGRTGRSRRGGGPLPRARRGAGDPPEGARDGRRARGAAQGRRSPLRRTRHRRRARCRAEGRGVRPHPVRPDGHRHGERHGRPHDGAAARPSLRHLHFPPRAGRRPWHRPARSGRRHRDRAVPPPRGADDRRRHRPAATGDSSRESWPPRRSRSTSVPPSSARSISRCESMALPPERTGGRIVGEGVDAVPELVRLLRTEAKVL